MQKRLGAGLAAISALFVMYVLYPDDRVSAIALDNDVPLGESAAGNPAPPSVNATVVGAPRLVRNEQELAGVTVAIEVSTSIESGPVLFAYRVDDLSPCVRFSVFNGVLNGSLGTGGRTVPLTSLLGDVSTGFVENCFSSSRSGVILVFQGQATIAFESGTPPSLTITLSGLGNPITVDQLGDRNAIRPGDPADVPPRSVQLVSRLGRLAEASGNDRSAELDEAGVDRPVGFTHAFRSPQQPVRGATLRLDVTSGSRGIRTDHLILDSGDGGRGGRRRNVIILLCHALQEVPVPRAEPYHVEVDLKHAPVAAGQTVDSSSCDSPPEWTNLLELVEGSRLDVIVSDDSQVDFSELLIVHSDVRAR